IGQERRLRGREARGQIAQRRAPAVAPARVGHAGALEFQLVLLVSDVPALLALQLERIDLLDDVIARLRQDHAAGDAGHGGDPERPAGRPPIRLERFFPPTGCLHVSTNVGTVSAYRSVGPAERRVNRPAASPATRYTPKLATCPSASGTASKWRCTIQRSGRASASTADHSSSVAARPTTTS